MIKNELRIGNFIDLGNRFGKISEIYFGGATVLDFEETQDTLEGWERVKPIEIIEEWLDFFKFKRIGNDFIRNGVFLHLRKRGWVIKKGIPPIKYIHELQNIYFCWTKEELDY